MARLGIYVGAMIPLIARILGNLTNSKEQKIYYKKPSGVTGYWDAQVLDANEGTIVYNTQSGDFDEAGMWLLQGWEKDEYDRENHGQRYYLEIVNVEFPPSS